MTWVILCTKKWTLWLSLGLIQWVKVIINSKWDTNEMGCQAGTDIIPFGSRFTAAILLLFPILPTITHHQISCFWIETTVPEDKKRVIYYVAQYIVLISIFLHYPFPNQEEQKEVGNSFRDWVISLEMKYITSHWGWYGLCRHISY